MVTRASSLRFHLTAVFVVIIAAIGDVIRARGPKGIAAQVGIEPNALLEAFRDGNDPPFSLVLAAVRALGFKLGVCRTS